MTIDEAIKTLKYWLPIWRADCGKDEVDAIELGIEALNQIKESRFDPSTLTPQTLPGETKD